MKWRIGIHKRPQSATTEASEYFLDSMSEKDQAQCDAQRDGRPVFKIGRSNASEHKRFLLIV